MTGEHPNITLLKKLDIGNLGEAVDLFAVDFVFHYFNPLLPDLAGDYAGPLGMQAFLGKVNALMEGNFRIEPKSITAVGDELVVLQNKNQVKFEGAPIKIDVVVVWRIVNGRFAEVWDIPSVYTRANEES